MSSGASSSAVPCRRAVEVEDELLRGRGGLGHHRRDPARHRRPRPPRGRCSTGVAVGPAGGQNLEAVVEVDRAALAHLQPLRELCRISSICGMSSLPGQTKARILVPSRRSSARATHFSTTSRIDWRSSASRRCGDWRSSSQLGLGGEKRIQAAVPDHALVARDRRRARSRGADPAKSSSTDRPVADDRHERLSRHVARQARSRRPRRTSPSSGICESRPQSHGCPSRRRRAGHSPSGKRSASRRSTLSPEAAACQDGYAMRNDDQRLDEVDREIVLQFQQDGSRSYREMARSLDSVRGHGTLAGQPPPGRPVRCGSPPSPIRSGSAIRC